MMDLGVFHHFDCGRFFYVNSSETLEVSYAKIVFVAICPRLSSENPYSSYTTTNQVQKINKASFIGGHLECNQNFAAKVFFYIILYCLQLKISLSGLFNENFARFIENIQHFSIIFRENTTSQAAILNFDHNIFNLFL